MVVIGGTTTQRNAMPAMVMTPSPISAPARE